ncbi:hypothetical protein V7200_16450 [Cytobacillus firmus]
MFHGYGYFHRRKPRYQTELLRNVFTVHSHLLQAGSFIPCCPFDAAGNTGQ